MLKETYGQHENDCPAYSKAGLIWRFLRGSKRYFAIAVLSAAVTALADMVDPQIIRMAVDNALGGLEPDYSPPSWISSRASAALSISGSTCG